MSQAVFARYLNLAVGYVSQLERGQAATGRRLALLTNVHQAQGASKRSSDDREFAATPDARGTKPQPPRPRATRVSRALVRRAEPNDIRVSNSQRSAVPHGRAHL